ncbi:MAG: hypothetical protein KGL39_48185, partial [Patescibacteria group bacterium]|nr:hypothetical protein [Patescibacteria group bacterium]
NPARVVGSNDRWENLMLQRGKKIVQIFDFKYGPEDGPAKPVMDKLIGDWSKLSDAMKDLCYIDDINVYDDGPHFVLQYERLETDEELQERQRSIDEYAANQENKERQLLAKLKAKYEPSN